MVSLDQEYKEKRNFLLLRPKENKRIEHINKCLIYSGRVDGMGGVNLDVQPPPRGEFWIVILNIYI